MILKPVMRPAMRSPMGSAMDWGRSNNPNAEAIALLRKFNASVWLFCSGNVGGLQAGNYLDSTLGTPVSIDGPIGGVMDALGTVGPELVTNGANFVNTAGWAGKYGASVSAVGGNLVCTAGASVFGSASYAITLVVGKTYRLAFDLISNAGAAGMYAFVSDEPGGDTNRSLALDSPDTPGNTTVYFTAITDASFIVIGAGQGGFDPGETFALNNISCVQVTGNHATQPTTANKPVLRVTGGKYYGEFDGINDSLLTGNLALTNTFSIVVAGNLSSLPSQQTLIGEDTGGAQVYVTSGGAIVFAKVGTGVLATTAAGEVVAGTPFVATATLAGGNAIIRKNGVQKVSTASALTLSATTGARIGGTFAGAEYCAGSLSAVGVLQGASTNAELLTIEKWAASITPGGPTI